MSATNDCVRLTKCALDATPSGDIVLRGVLDPKTIHCIKVDDYQREVLPLSSLSNIANALKNGRQVPDVTIGMRGGDYVERDGVFTLKDEVYVIDGLQRLSSATHVMRTGGNLDPHLGAIVYFNTTRNTENELFRILNTSQTKLAPSVLIRGVKETNVAIEMMFNLCFDKSFAMSGKICWQQRMKRGELITAMQLLRVTNILHSSFGPTLATRWDEACRGAERIMKTVGRTTMRENIKTYFEVLDSGFGIRSLSFKEGATHLRSGFMQALALMLAHHKNFWDGSRKLVIAADNRRKLSNFPMNDPNVQKLATSNQKGQMLLYRFLVDHMNSGKRTHRLVAFKKSDPIIVRDDADDIEVVRKSQGLSA